MNWDKYRQAMDDLPISEDFEQRVNAAVREQRGRMAREVREGTARNGRTLARRKRQARGPAARLGTVGKAAAAAAICVALGGTAFAAASLGDLADIARDAEQEQLADAFAQGNGVRIDETQQVGDFDITLLGIASGQDLGAFLEAPATDRTYAVLSLVCSDGTPLDEAYRARSSERWLESGTIQEDGSGEVDISALPRDEEGFDAETFLIDNVCLTPIAATSDGVLEARGELGYTMFTKDGAMYLVADLPAAEGESAVNYLAVWLGSYAGSDLPGNRFEDHIVVGAQGVPTFAEGTAGALFELPAM